jgi:hypothetical protein
VAERHIKKVAVLLGRGISFMKFLRGGMNENRLLKKYNIGKRRDWTRAGRIVLM